MAKNSHFLGHYVFFAQPLRLKAFLSLVFSFSFSFQTPEIRTIMMWKCPFATMRTTVIQEMGRTLKLVYLGTWEHYHPPTHRRCVLTNFCPVFIFKVPSLSLLKNFNHQIYSLDLPVLFMV